MFVNYIPSNFHPCMVDRGVLLLDDSLYNSLIINIFQWNLMDFCHMYRHNTLILSPVYTSVLFHDMNTRLPIILLIGSREPWSGGCALPFWPWVAVPCLASTGWLGVARPRPQGRSHASLSHPRFMLPMVTICSTPMGTLKWCRVAQSHEGGVGVNIYGEHRTDWLGQCLWLAATDRPLISQVMSKGWRMAALEIEP